MLLNSDVSSHADDCKIKKATSQIVGVVFKDQTHFKKNKPAYDMKTLYLNNILPDMIF